jgi:hypothetical protein
MIINNLKLPFNLKDSQCPKLSQYHYALFFILHKMNPEIRSIDILVFLSKLSDISVHPSWINKKLKQMGCDRPIGRPSNEYIANRSYYFQKMDEMTFKIEQLGIPFIITLMDSLGLTDLFVDTIKDLLENNSASLPKNIDALSRFIHTLTQIILDPRVHNFEEGMRSEMPYKEMNIERCRQLIKECEEINNFIPSLVESFLDYWIEKLGLKEKGMKIIIYIDGHGSHYYTKESFVCGRMSITGDIAPGTHHVITTTDEGYILILYPESVNTHLNEGLLLSCIHLKKRLGDLVELIVVDRECNGNEFNNKIKKEYAVETLTGLRSNQYQDINDFDYEWLIEEILAKGHWKDKKKRKDDPRTFLLYPQKDKLYVLVTTSQDSKMHEQALSYQKSRWPKNEGVIKILVNELDFNINVGNGKELVANPKKSKLQHEYDKKVERCNEHINKIDNKLKIKNPPSIEKHLKESKKNGRIEKKNIPKNIMIN